MTRQEIDKVADRYAEMYGLDPENVGVDYTRGTIEVDATELALLLDPWKRLRTPPKAAPKDASDA